MKTTKIEKRPRRSEVIHARVTPEVKCALSRRAKRLGMSLSEYVEQNLVVIGKDLKR